MPPEAQAAAPAPAAAFRERACPVCGERASTRVVVEENLPPERFNAFTYASRKEPEFMSLRLVECAGCGIAYAPRIPTSEALVGAYREAAFDSGDEADMAARTYMRLLAPALAGLDTSRAAIEIGAGTGALLPLLAARGFRTVRGFEPSAEAVRAAPEEARPYLVEAPFAAESLEPGGAAFVGCFMTLEHVDDPGAIVDAAYRALVPGGIMAVVVHDRRALLNRVLGRRSPIIDVEHLQLFSPSDIERLFRARGFSGVVTRHFANTYRLRYWLRLLPVPRALRRGIVAAAAAIGLDRVPVTVPVGNLLAVAVKPAETEPNA